MDEELNRFEIMPEYNGNVDSYDISTSSTTGNAVRLGIKKRKCSTLIILADSNNTATILIGKDNPTFPLTAGTMITLRDIDASTITATSTALSQKLHLIASW